MATQGTSNSQMGAKRWAATGAIDDLNIDLDNDASTDLHFVHPARVTRLAFEATTAVVAAADVKVEVYKNGTGGTLLGTWTVCKPVTGDEIPAGKIAYAVCAKEVAEAVQTDGSKLRVAPSVFDFKPGEWITLKVVEPSSSGAGIAWVEYVEYPIHSTTDNVAQVGSVA